MAKIRLPYVPLPQSAVTPTHLHVSNSLSRLLQGSGVIDGVEKSFGEGQKPTSSAIINLGLTEEPSPFLPASPRFIGKKRSGETRAIIRQFQDCISAGDTHEAYKVWATTEGNVETVEKAAQSELDESPGTTVFPVPAPRLPNSSILKLLKLLEETDPSSPLLFKLLHSLVSSPETASVFAPAVFRAFVHYFEQSQYSTIIKLWTAYANNGGLVGTKTNDYIKFVAVVAPAFIAEEFESRGSREGAAQDLVELLGPEAPYVSCEKMVKTVKRIFRGRRDRERLQSFLDVLRPRYNMFLNVQATHSKQRSILEQVQRARDLDSVYQLNYWWSVARKSSRDQLTVEQCQAFISAYSALKNAAGAFKVWELMESSGADGIVPTLECWEALLEAASHVSSEQAQFFQKAWDGMVMAGFTPTPRSYVHKFRWLRRNRYFQSADNLFSDILAGPSDGSGVLPGLTQEVLEAYIPCLLRKFRHQEAEQLVELLSPRDSINITLPLASLFLDFYLRHKLVDSMPPWLSKLEQHGLFTTPESFVMLVAYNVLYITEVAPQREVVPVLVKIYQQMEAQGISLSQDTFSRLISEAYKVCPQIPAARSVFDSMIRADIVPNTNVIMKVLKGECSYRGDVLMGQELLHSMTSMTSNVDFQKPVFWNFLLQALLRQEKYEEALVSYNKMKGSKVLISGHTYTTMLSGLSEDFREAKQSLLTELASVREPKRTYLISDRLREVLGELQEQGYDVGTLLGTEAPPRWK